MEMAVRVTFNKYLNFMKISIVKKHFNHFKKIVAELVVDPKEETAKIVRKDKP